MFGRAEVVLSNLPAVPITFREQERPACWKATSSIHHKEQGREQWPWGKGSLAPLPVHPFRMLCLLALAPSPKLSTWGIPGEIHCQVWEGKGRGWQ